MTDQLMMQTGSDDGVEVMDAAECALVVDNISVDFEGVTAVRDLSFSVRAGEQLTLLGPSGCGKSTTLRAIAGLETPTTGRISVFGRVVFDSNAQIDVPAHRRHLSMVFQSYAIWPHMSVFDNVAYGLKGHRRPRAEIRKQVMNALDLVDLADVADKPAPLLSGGQQQRVALARAIAFEAKLILFDEPLSNLDASLRKRMRQEIRTLQTQLNLTSLFVTHDQDEALSMSDTLAVMRDGQICELGDPTSLYFLPTDPFVATFVGGSNLIQVRSARVGPRADTLTITTAGGFDVEANATIEPELVQSIAIKPTHFRICEVGKAPLDLENASLANVSRCIIATRSFMGGLVEYEMHWMNLRIRVETVADAVYEVGESVDLYIPSERVIPLAAPPFDFVGKGSGE